MSIALLIIGLALLTFAVWNHRRHKRMMRSGTRVTAVVVDNYVDEMNNRTLYFPEVEFTNVQGQKVRARLRTGSNIRKNAGTPMEVVYDPTDPEIEVIAWSKSVSVPHLIFIIVGALFFFAGIIGLLIKIVWEYAMSAG